MVTVVGTESLGTYQVVRGIFEDPQLPVPAVPSLGPALLHLPARCSLWTSGLVSSRGENLSNEIAHRTPFEEGLAQVQYYIKLLLITASISDTLGGSQGQQPCLEADEVA